MPDTTSYLQTVSDTNAGASSQSYLQSVGGNAPPPPVDAAPQEEQYQLPVPEIPTATATAQQWNYQNAISGPHGELLPENALGWKPDGTPYFGEGLSAKWNEYKWRFTDRTTNAPTEQEWVDVAKQFDWDIFSPGSTGFSEAVKTNLALIPKIASMTGQQLGSASENAGVLTPVTQGVRLAVEGVFDLFQQPAIVLERALGAGKAVVEEFDNNPFSGMSHVGTTQQRLSASLEEGWQSGRILYSSIYDPTREAEFLRRYRAGEDPALLAMELQNPLAEAIGQSVLDPLNFVGVISKAAKWTGVLDDATDAVKATGVLADTRHAAIVEEAVNVGSDALAAEKKIELAQAQIKAVDAIENGKLLKQKYSPFALSSSSRQEILLKKSADYVGVVTSNMFQMGMSGDEVVDFFRYGIMSVSKNTNEVQAGIEGILRLPGGRMGLSEQGVQTFSVMRDLLKGEDGSINFARLNKLSEAEKFSDFAKEAATLLSSATAKKFPSVMDMSKAYDKAQLAEKQGSSVSKGTKALAAQFELLKKNNPAVVYFSKFAAGPEKTKRAINTGLGTFYFSLQGGVAAKNWLNNTETILIDLGTSAFYRDEKFWSKGDMLEDLDGWLGFRPTTAVGFGTQVTSEGAKAIGFGKWMQSTEEAAGVRATDAAFSQGMKKLLKPILKDTAELKAAGYAPNEISYLQKLFYTQKGNAAAIAEKFRQRFGKDMIEGWRTLDFIPEAHVRGFDEIGLSKEIEALAENALTPDDIKKGFAKLRKAIEQRAKFANKDVPGVSSPEAGDIIAMLQEAVEAGDLDNAPNVVLSAAVEASYKARDEYITAMDGFFTKNQSNPEIMPLLQQWSQLKSTFIQGGASVSKTNKDVMNGVRALSDNLDDIKNPNYADLWEQWGLGLRHGKAPVDLDMKSLKSALWEDGRLQVASNWETYFNSIFNGSESIVDQARQIAPEVESAFEKSRQAAAQAEAYRSAVYVNGELRIPTSLEVRTLAKDYGIPSISPKGAPLDKTILKIINENAPTTYANLDEVPYEAASQALEKWRIANGRPEAKITQFVSIVPPYPNASTPSVARAWYESGEFITRALNETEAEIIKRWGKMVPGGIDDVKEAALSSFISKATPKVSEAKVYALKAAEYWRDFILHDYGARTYSDLAVSYILPYQFWYSRSYANWMKRVVSDPQIIAGYARYKDMMGQLHSDMPEWYRYNVEINNLLGIELDHPLYFNLEAALNPLYGITSPDFNDPAKRFDAVTRTVDDIGKFGPSVWAPLQFGMAVYATAKGEEDAASRWGGRLIPETATIKSASSLPGVTDVRNAIQEKLGFAQRPIELDPNVWIFGGGMDAYERARVGRAAAELTQMGYSEEEVFDAVRNQQGPLWDMAYQMATAQRAPGQIGSWLLGVGFKARSETDVQIDQMYTDIGGLYSQSENMPPEQFKMAWEELRKKYPFMDTVLLSRKAGAVRDAAYAYNVLGRMPPGEMDNVLALVGIDQTLVNAFYDNKGVMSKWGQGEREHFMGAIARLSSVMQMPSVATKQEWLQTKTMYRSVEEQISQQLGIPYQDGGRGIWDTVQAYYDLLESDPQRADALKELYPIQQALDMKKAYIANNPELYKYYGSLDTLESYYQSRARAELTKKYGNDIYELSMEYTILKDRASKAYYMDGVVPPEAKAEFNAFKQQYEAKLKQFWNEKDSWMKWVDQSTVEIGSKMPQQEPIATRQIQNPTEAQSALMGQVNAPRQVQAQEILANKSMRPEMAEMVKMYFTSGGRQELPSGVLRRLEPIAQQYGLTLAEMLQILGIYFSQ